ncbi:PKD domain-containing protein [Owenweeksia hongkongensis]|uniref:PKD domain-containing protein n=1 Tax=Owenweeksia hongkongensis TaxID=253245 RepID=UPI003A916CEB
MKTRFTLQQKTILLLFIGLLDCGFIWGQNFSRLNDPTVTGKTGSWRSTALIDYNNNLTLDIFMGGGSLNANGLLYNSGDSTFLDSSSLAVITQSTVSGQSFWADIDNDCDLDVFWPDAYPATNPFFLNNGSAGFSQMNNVVTSSIIYSVTASWLDYNQDGDIDLFVPSWNGDTNYLYRNDGNLSFTRIDTGEIATSIGAIWSSISADYDNDGDPDIFMANNETNGKNFLLKNHGGGVFKNDTSSIITKEGGSCNTASWGDFNNDGWIDLFVGRYQLTNLLYKNNGDGTFTKITTGPLVTSNAKTGGSVWADLDNDGYLDMYLSIPGSSANNNIIYMNNGNETFSDVTSGPVYAETYSTEGCNVADLNNDGFLDIINSNRSSSPISIFLNNGNSNNFLKLALHGSASNRAAIGSRIEIITASGKQMRYMGAGSGRRSQEPFEIHFGLGQDTVIDTLKIFWPSNNVCTLSNVPVNAFYNIGELTCSLDSLVSPDYSDSTSFLTAHFSNLSNGSISSYEWNFGDGQTSTQTNPVHHYSQAGKYEVTLKVFDNFCKSTFITDSIEICPDTAKLGFYTSMQGTAVTFNDTSISNGYSFQWNFGDGNSGNGSIANHTYTAAGNYNVCLYVTDSCRIDTLCQTITVCSDTLTAAFGQTTSALNVSFIDSSVNATSIVWDFGDGTTDTATNPTHTYAAPGYYTVCQTVMDICTSTTTCETIGVCLDTAISKFSYSDTLNTIWLISNAQNANSILWDFGDGNLSTNLNPTHTYLQYGTYTVCLIVSNDCYTDTLCQNITICPVKGIADYTYQHVGQSLAVRFHDKSTYAQSYFWDFGDGSLSTMKNPLIVYSRAWVYNVCLTITDTCGKEDKYCEEINMMPFSIGELSLLESIKVFPNPADDFLQIELPAEIKSGTIISLYDLNGKLLIERGVTENKEQVTLDLSSLAKGLYLLDLNLNGASRQVKIVKN